MRYSLGVVVASSFAALALACNVPVDSEDGQNEQNESENLGQAQQEQKKADPLFASVCRACGCEMVTRTIDNCQVTRCECSSTEKAECVVKAPGGTATVVQPPRQSTLARNDYGAVLRASDMLSPPFG